VLRHVEEVSGNVAATRRYQWRVRCFSQRFTAGCDAGRSEPVDAVGLVGAQPAAVALPTDAVVLGRRECPSMVRPSTLEPSAGTRVVACFNVVKSVLPLCGGNDLSGYSGSRDAGQRRAAAIIHRPKGRVGVRSRCASDVARETPTGRCSEPDADTSNRPRSCNAQRPCPRRNAPRRRRADTAPEPTEPSATP
jgi:hypothetical protein